MRGRPTFLLAVLVFFRLWLGVAAADTVDELPPTEELVRFEPAFEKRQFDRPIWVGPMPGRPEGLVVGEQSGRILFVGNGAGDGEELLLDLRGPTRRRHNEEGLLGLAFHPDFASNGELYIHNSRSGPRRGVVSRFLLDAETGSFSLEREEILLELEQPWGNHNGGDLRFGPDGFLYIRFGDGGAGGDPLGSGQDRSTLLGSILRIDVAWAKGGQPYGIPSDNPFDGEKGVRPEIYAYGLRNVWRFSFDRQTGALWAGDVGQDRYEEIDRIEVGGNYGWNLREGHHPFGRRPAGEDLKEPVLDYTRRLARSITGGFVYRGIRVPALQGAYVHGDYETGYVWALWYDGARVTRHVTLGRVAELSSFGEDESGELYLCSLRGTIYRMQPREQGEP